MRTRFKNIEIPTQRRMILTPDENEEVTGVTVYLQGINEVKASLDSSGMLHLTVKKKGER